MTFGFLFHLIYNMTEFLRGLLVKYLELPDIPALSSQMMITPLLLWLPDGKDTFLDQQDFLMVSSNLL
jgi:hypothetical protein